MSSSKKIIVKLFFGILVIVGIVIAAVYLLSSSRMSKTYDVALTPITAPTDQTSIEEGKRLYVTRGCSHCHGDDLSGMTFIDNPVMGVLSGVNLTTGIGGAAKQLTDSEFARAIRHGVGANGRALIFMPSTDFNGMSDEDVAKIISYIRSAPPIDNVSPQQKVGPVGRVLFVLGKLPLLVTAEIIDHQVKAPAQVAAGETVEYGKYLAQGCTGCHGPGLSGGTIVGGPPDWPPAKNITPAGIGKWSDEDFIKTIRTGVNPNGEKIRPPMPWENLSQMTDVELKALSMYLHSIPEKATGNR